MKTLSNIIFSILLLCLVGSCEEEESMCGEDNSNEEFIEWSFNDQTFVVDFDHIDVYYADDRILNIYTLSPEPNDGPIKDFMIKYDILEGSADYRAGAVSPGDTFIYTYGSNLDMKVSEFSSKGELICIQFDNGEFSGELRVVLDKIVKSGKVEGGVWLDQNKNGIREADEDPLADVYLSLETDSEELEAGTHSVYPIYYPKYSFKTDENGNFTIDVVFVNYPIQLVFVTREDNNVTAANKGNDDTIDSDFNFSLQVDNRKLYTTDPFTIEEGGTKNDIGLGIIEE